MAPPPTVQGVAADIGKRQPFELLEQEVAINLYRAHDRVYAQHEQLFKSHGLSHAKFNVLRILRGKRDDPDFTHGVRVQQIADNMVSREPDVTRLIDRLERQALVTRTRCTTDRRVVWIQITQAGLDTLAKLDRPLLDLHKREMNHLSKRELDELNTLLYKLSKPPQPEDAR